MKISLPDSLRQRITDCLAQLDADMKAAAGQRADLTAKIATYEAAASQVTSTIAALKGQILQDAHAADKIPPMQLRAEALATALVELRGKLATQEPVSLYAATAVIRAVIEHWKSELPEAFADAVGAAYGTRQSAINAANLSDARRYLPALANRCYQWNQATPANVGFIQEILKRALAGQPHLGLDAA